MCPSLWAQPTSVIAHIDGASRGNPGPAAYGVLLETAGGERLAAFSKFLGQATNNVAEYQALIAALDYSLERQHLRLKVISDSELLTRQIEGRYKVKSPDLIPLHARARGLISKLESFRIVHLPREQNREADRLANQALDAADVKSSDAARPLVQAAVGGDLKSAQAETPSGASEVLRVSATHDQGVLKLPRGLPLAEGEEVDVVIRRRRPRPR